MAIGHQAFDRFYDHLDDLITDGTIIPAWSPDGRSLAFLEGAAEDRRGWLVDLATGARAPLVDDVPALREAIGESTGQTPAGCGLPFAHLAFVAARQVAVAVGTAQVTIDLDSGEVTRLPDESFADAYLGASETARRTPREFLRTQPLTDPVPAREVAAPDGTLLASTVDGNIVLRSTVDGRSVLLTTDGTPEHEYRFDLVDPMLINLNMAFPVCNWSPDGSRLAVYKVDNHGVHLAHQLHYLKREDELVQRYHGQAGGPLERTTLQVLDVYGGSPVQLDLGDPTDTYPVHAAWLPDGSNLVVFVMSRDCRRVDVLLADARTGSTRPIFSEEGQSFLRMHHDVYFGRKLGLFLTPDGTQLLWLSERSGWKHLYLYDLDGTPIRQLTDGDWPVDYVHRIDNGYAYLTAHLDQDRPYDIQLARVPIAGGPIERLSPEPGVHAAMFAPDGNALVDTWWMPDQAPRSVLRRTDGSLLTEMSTADSSQLAWISPRQFTVTADDGETDLWGVMYFPNDFDETKQYPLIEYVYGGPQIAISAHAFLGAFNKAALALAQLGYVTIVLDGRGTPGRSKAFHDVVVGDWATGIVSDHATAVQQLKDRHGFLAAANVGVIGHSWGGYSAFRLAADRPDVYTAAVSSAPGFDPYSSVLYECYLGLPQSNRAAYQKAETYPLADRMEAAFLLACGSSDHATWTDSMKMSEALIRAGKDHEFVVLPEQLHGFDSVHDTYFWRKVAAFFDTHLRNRIR